MDEATILARRSLGLPFTHLEELDNTVKVFFDGGPAVTSKKFAALQSAVLDGETEVDLGFVLPFMERQIPWNPCRLATTLVLLLACSGMLTQLV